MLGKLPSFPFRRKRETTSAPFDLFAVGRHGATILSSSGNGGNPRCRSHAVVDGIGVKFSLVNLFLGDQANIKGGKPISPSFSVCRLQRRLVAAGNVGRRGRPIDK